MKYYFSLFLIILATFASADAAKTYGWKRLLPYATFDMAVNPQNPNSIFVGGYSREVYKSEDGGKTWRTSYIVAPSSMAKLNNVLYSHKDTNVIIAGGINVVDMFRSPNGGLDWDVVSQNISIVYLNGKALFEDPKEPGRFYFASFDTGLIYESTDDGKTWDSISTVYKPSKWKYEDGTIVDTLIKQLPTCIGIRPDSTNIILAGNQGGHIMLSTDKGKTWKFTATLKTGEPLKEKYDTEVTMFYFNDIDPRRMYAVITYTLEGNTPNGGLWRSDDGGYNWQLAAFPDTSFWGVACKGLPNEEIFVGGYTADPLTIDSMNVPGNKIVRGSFDSGKTWWVFDNEVEWADPNRVIKSIRTKDNRTTVAGSRAYLSSASNNKLQWQVEGFYKKSVDINDFYEISPSEFLLIGREGKIFTNYKKGFSWDSLQTNTIENLNSVVATSELAFCVVGDNGTIMTSRNNIGKWTVSPSEVTNNLYSIARTGNKLFTVGEDGILLTSDDNAASWSSRILTNYDLFSIDFADENHGMAVGEMGTMLKTTNGGIDWTPMKFDTGDTLFGVKMYNKDIAIAVGKKSRVLYTSDGGDTWVNCPQPVLQDLYAATFISADSVLIAGSSETIIFSKDATKQWDVSTSQYGPTGNIWSLRYFGPKDKQKLYMATEAGFFVLEDIETSIEEIISADPTANLNIVLNNSVLTVAYRRAYPGDRNLLKMRVVDINGVVVFQKESKDFMFENILDNISLGNLSAGAYLVEYIERDVKSVKKFIIE